MEGITDEPGLTRQAGERGHLTIRRHPSARNATNDDENA